MIKGECEIIINECILVHFYYFLQNLKVFIIYKLKIHKSMFIKNKEIQTLIWEITWLLLKYGFTDQLGLEVNSHLNI